MVQNLVLSVVLRIKTNGAETKDTLKKEIKEKLSSKRKTQSSSSESQSDDVSNRSSSSIQSDESDKGNGRIRKSSSSDLLKEKSNWYCYI